MLLDPDIVVKFFLNTLKRTICLVRVLYSEQLLKLVLKLPNEFWEEM